MGVVFGHKNQRSHTHNDKQPKTTTGDLVKQATEKATQYPESPDSFEPYVDSDFRVG